MSETCTNLPFGDGQSCTGTNWGFNFFTDDPHDSESNLEHTWFRQLSASEGRWLSPDPYMGSMDIGDPQSLNRYAYVLNNPVNYWDPFVACSPPLPPTVLFHKIAISKKVSISPQKSISNVGIPCHSGGTARTRANRMNKWSANTRIAFCQKIGRLQS